MGAVSVHDVHFGITVSLGLEDDARPIGRPGGVQVVAGVVRETVEAGAIGPHYVYLKVAVAERPKGDTGAVG